MLPTTWMFISPFVKPTQLGAVGTKFAVKESESVITELINPLQPMESLTNIVYDPDAKLGKELIGEKLIPSIE